jgi:hypothetical protein
MLSATASPAPLRRIPSRELVYRPRRTHLGVSARTDKAPRSAEVGSESRAPRLTVCGHRDLPGGGHEIMPTRYWSPTPAGNAGYRVPVVLTSAAVDCVWPPRLAWRRSRDYADALLVTDPGRDRRKCSGRADRKPAIIGASTEAGAVQSRMCRRSTAASGNVTPITQEGGSWTASTKRRSTGMPRPIVASIPKRASSARGMRRRPAHRLGLLDGRSQGRRNEGDARSGHRHRARYRPPAWAQPSVRVSSDVVLRPTPRSSRRIRR